MICQVIWLRAEARELNYREKIQGSRNLRVRVWHIHVRFACRPGDRQAELELKYGKSQYGMAKYT